MNKLRVLVVLLLLSTAVSADFDYQLKAKKVAENVYCFFGAVEKISKINAGDIVNTCYVKTKDGFVVIDSGPTFAYAKQAYEQMKKIDNLPVKYVINTHDHDDHWLGNSFYKSRGARLIGPRTYDENIIVGMQTRMQMALGKELFGQTTIVQLDSIVDDNLTLHVGGEKFEITQPISMAHTKGDLIVYLAGKKVLFVGDLVFHDRIASLRHGSLLGSLEALDVIDSYHAQTVIGGHGYQTNESSTDEFRRYLTEIKKQVSQALDEDIGMEQITQKVKMPYFQKFKLYNVLHNRNVLDAYKELEMMEDEDE